jgi:hypothetical protein
MFGMILGYNNSQPNIKSEIDDTISIPIYIIYNPSLVRSLAIQLLGCWHCSWVVAGAGGWNEGFGKNPSVLMARKSPTNWKNVFFPWENQWKSSMNGGFYCHVWLSKANFMTCPRNMFRGQRQTCTKLLIQPLLWIPLHSGMERLAVGIPHRQASTSSYSANKWTTKLWILDGFGGSLILGHTERVSIDDATSREVVAQQQVIPCHIWCRFTKRCGVMVC